MLENDQEIILDSTNNVFVGPDGYFKIVIDEFDGQTVKAWHVEDAKGNKTGNLADRAKGKHIDLLINADNRTVWHFANRIATTLVKEQQAKIAELQARIAELEKPQAITVKINGKEQTFAQPPVIVNGSTLVPLRGIFEALGAEVNWDEKTQTVTAVKGSVTVVLKIGSGVATKNGTMVRLDQPPQLVNGSTMVPIRFVSEALGANVTWDEATKTVNITTQ